MVIDRVAWAYSFLAIHVFTASSTALDRSPFFPPNLSTVFILSCFSNSSGRSTLIRPIFNHLIYWFWCTFPHVRHFSNKWTVKRLILFLFLFSFFYSLQFAYWLINISHYVLTRLYRYWLNLTQSIKTPKYLPLIQLAVYRIPFEL